MIIVDEFTGRTLAGRRWSDGLHQAVEAKEGVPIQRENQTLATITFQNLFRMYKKLAGMTGTADTEAYEFQTDLRPGSGGHPHPPADDPRGQRRTSCSSVQSRSTRRSSRTSRLVTSAASRCWSVPPRSRCPSCCRTCCARKRSSARSAQREAARARSAHRRAGRCARPGHDRHQHGRSRYRHRARRQPRRGACRSCRKVPAMPTARKRARPMEEAATSRCSPPAACTSSAPSATNRVVSTTSCAAVPVARAIRVPRVSTSRCRTTCCASSPATGSAAGCDASA